MRNIIAVSMISNEMDIIELFINHTINIVNKLLIYIHNSFDGTGEILKKLSENELKNKLYIYIWEPVEYSQSEAMTKLVKKAFNEFNADIVIPIDVDEFIVTKDDDFNPNKIRKILEEIELGKIYEINKYDCRREKYKKYFLDIKEKFFKSNIQDKSNKIIITKNDFNKERTLTVEQGNHCLTYKDGKKIIVDSELIDSIHYNHFRIRSKNQFLRKNVLGSLSNICKFGKETRKGWHWIANLELILDHNININDKFKGYNSSYKLISFKNIKIKIKICKTIKYRSFENLLIQLAKKISIQYYNLKMGK